MHTAHPIRCVQRYLLPMMSLEKIIALGIASASLTYTKVNVVYRNARKMK